MCSEVVFYNEKLRREGAVGQTRLYLGRKRPEGVIDIQGTLSEI